MEIAVLTVQGKNSLFSSVRQFLELNKILPFKLGITVRDSCWTERIAMEQVSGNLSSL